MKFEIDTDTKQIVIKSTCNITDLFKILNELNINFDDYNLVNKIEQPFNINIPSQWELKRPAWDTITCTV